MLLIKLITAIYVNHDKFLISLYFIDKDIYVNIDIKSFSFELLK